MCDKAFKKSVCVSAVQPIADARWLAYAAGIASVKKRCVLFQEIFDLLDQVDAMDDVAEVVEFVGLYDGFGAEIVSLKPFLVLRVELLDVGKGDRHLGFAPAFLDAPADTAHGTTEINEQIWGLELAPNGLIEFHVRVVIALCDASTAAKILDENLRILVDRSVEYDALFRLLGFEMKGIFSRQIKDLRVESPSLHIFVEIGDIGVVIDRFIEWCEAISLGEEADHCGFSGTDVPGDSDKSCSHKPIKTKSPVYQRG